MVEFFSPILVGALLFVTFGLLKAGFGTLSSIVKAIGNEARKKADRKTIGRLLELPRAPYQQGWRLSAPVSRALLEGIEDKKSDGFKLGLLQLLAMKALIMDVVFKSNTRVKNGFEVEETILEPGSVSKKSLKGSVLAIYNLWENLPEPRTIKSLIQQARKTYGSLRDFNNIEVKTSLVAGGLYEKKENQYQIPSYATSYAMVSRNSLAVDAAETQIVTTYQMTPLGDKVKSELESQLGERLRQIKRERPEWIQEKPNQALISVMVSLATVQFRLVEDTEMQLINKSSETAAFVTAGQQKIADPNSYDQIWIDWDTLTNLDRVYEAVETECDNGGQDSDNDTGGGDGGDSGGDCGGGGGD